MSQVMPDFGAVSTDGEVLPELYHQAVRTMLEHRGNQILMRDVRSCSSRPPVNFRISISATTEFPQSRQERIDFAL
jgi:hypothetical protein